MRVFGYISLLTLISGAVLGCKSNESGGSAKVEALQARIVESRQEQIAATLQATGTLRARESVTLSAQVMGRVQQVLVREGDYVRAGQALVILDDATLKSASEQAVAAVKAADNQQITAQKNADLASSTLARYQQLQSQKSVSPQEMDEVTRRAEAASAQVDALRAQATALRAQQSGAQAMLGYTRIAAPFAGVITARLVDPGALASPGVPLIQIDSSDPLQLQTAVSESALASVHTGMKVSVSIDGAPNSDPQGTVSQIVSTADPSSHTFLIKIDLSVAKDLRTGMYATADIPIGTKQAVLAPRSAIVVRGSLPCAYVLDGNNIAQLRYMTLGSSHGDLVEVLSGIAANERLVDIPADRELAGKHIEVQQ